MKLNFTLTHKFIDLIILGVATAATVLNDINIGVLGILIYLLSNVLMDKNSRTIL